MNSLYFVDRVTLVQFSLSCILDYTMQAYAIPISVCDQVEIICLNFIWSSTEEHHKCRLIPQDKIYSPKEKCGFGLRSMNVLNEVYMLKLAYNLFACPNKLWVRLMRAKYGCIAHVMPKISPRGSTSHIWHAISRTWLNVECNILWMVQNNQDTHFWKDSWTFGGDINCDYCPDSIPIIQEEFSLSIYVMNDSWHMDVVEGVLFIDLH